MARSIDDYLRLSQEFSANSFHLYLVGGSVRDLLIKKEIDDFDLATDATPEEMEKFLKGCDMTFAKYGAVKVTRGKTAFVVTTFREEGKYKDSRHPNKIIFVRDMERDVKRRDFTLNGLYMDDHFKIYDFVDGQNDIKNKVVKMIGNPSKRLKEDPLRILRAARFALKYDFSLDFKLLVAIKANVKNLAKLNKEKVKEELNKFTDVDEVEKETLFRKLNISKYIQSVLK